MSRMATTGHRWKRSGALRTRTLALVLGCFAVLFPFVWFASIAFRPETQQFQPFPTSLTLDNFREMTQRVPEMASYYLDSVIVTGLTVIGVVVVAALSGYALSRSDFPGHKILFGLLTLTLFLPPVLAIAALYQELLLLGWLDTYQGLVLVYVAWFVSLGAFIMRTIFDGIPGEMIEAAVVDGANRWQIFRWVMFPLARGGAVVVALFTFIPAWGEFIFAFTFAGIDVQPMALGIKAFTVSASDPDFSFPVAAAAALVMFIPAFAIYIIFQRWFSRGLLEGGLKG